MTTTSRQNNIILNQDWTRIYQTFKNADFKSYDFENLRRVIITYLRENYPEDFNDYIESSEYMALVDAVAFLGQSLAFRIDLASRENFIELAERKESVLRLARMLGYNSKRNKPATGLLKFTRVTTSEEILDSNGRNLARQAVSWNDPTNPNWAEQFILILNAAMADNVEFGRSQGSAIIQGIPTEQYRFRTYSDDIPIYTFTKTVSGRNSVFELLSTSFKDSEDLYEESPTPGNQLGFIYRNDSRGPASANTGFYLLFKQGSLELADFSIDVPTTNEKVSVESININEDDVWLYSLNAQGQHNELWTKVSSLVGNNISYNSIEKNIRNIYAINTRDNDRVDLVFADGIYGNLPQGTFRVYYRVSNGLTYSISPNELSGINISIPYLNSRGAQHVLTVTLSLQYTVTNASASETTDSVRNNAPALYYTQNRMITGEDYNLAPLTSSQDILKIKAINRTSSGISRNFEIIDASGKYSSVNVFANDGYVYRNESEKVLNFKFANRIDIINFIRKSFEPQLTSVGIYNYYLTKYDRKILTGTNVEWITVTSDINTSTGYFRKLGFVEKVGVYVENPLRYIAPDALVKFVPPAGYAFKGNTIVAVTESNSNDPELRYKIWTKVIRAVGDGTHNGTGILPSGVGTITINEIIPSTSSVKPLVDLIVPKFVSDLPTALEVEMITQIFQNRNFGLRYDIDSTSWKIITAGNLDLLNDFSLDNQGDVTNSNLDSSWLVSFVKDVDQYVVTVRQLDYIFGSEEENRFYFDINDKAYNERTGTVVKDLVKVLSINSQPNLSSPIGRDIDFEIEDTIKFSDGYESSSEILVSFHDQDDDGVIDDPEIFGDVVGDESVDSYIHFKEIIGNNGSVEYQLIDESILNRRRESDVDLSDTETYPVGQLIYFYDSTENRVKRVTTTSTGSRTLTLASEYRGNKGRKNLKFQYIHNASSNRRIDPSASNIIDIFLLTRSYDESFRQYVSGALTVMPEAPTTESLRISFGANLGAIKAISDEIIYHPVKYKILFGSNADDKLKAQFKIVKNPSKVINDNDLKVRVINAINEFFNVDNWDFGDRFYLSELTTYILNQTAPDISNLIILPRQTTQSFGSLFEIQSNPDEIFISSAKVDDVEVVSAINAAEVRANPATIINET